MNFFIHSLFIYYTVINILTASAINLEEQDNLKKTETLAEYSYTRYVTCCTTRKKLIYSIIYYFLFSLGLILTILGVCLKNINISISGILNIILSAIIKGFVKGMYKYFEYNELLNVSE